ncbi:uncharacterized protein TOT_020000617 [Theileria orientalis strain Shintoku]|uniref:t-SNARE coiled-coil homology domain-containing protein n=1 Tax=Theileria orientalis strain Shintoku TaxID=869250 RepID=J4DPA4_THEOR|nr:uncharacterized protein TOT_020000617 [Theileria orientalis strain Shintoku]PVC51002.1 hypothetical protein MACL_00001858 [Theileria orientalis]BAM40359.1 uncharacterized protein TOT_020000617 [Theileria orientalis strain Shintoku]|eukprot:XP_009690660.1 uncharacterized protein TOT_020000617 [Theileria orientalis strain Shintoku]
MPKKYAKSTMGAMAARNTRVANAAKKAVQDFKMTVTNILREGSAHDKMSNIQRKKILKDVQNIQEEASNILTSLYEYSEELREKNVSKDNIWKTESFILYDSLLDEFKQHMSKLEDLQNKLVNYQKSLTNSISDIKHDIYVDEDEKMELEQEQLLENIVEYPLENNILQERSQQIKDLRSSVHGIQDMYVEIGDMVDYQGDQLDDIENNMLNVVFDSRVANQNLRSIDRSTSTLPKTT